MVSRIYGKNIAPILDNFDLNAQNYINVVNGAMPKTEIGDHEIEFELVDKNNTCWDIILGSRESESTENQTVVWHIQKAVLDYATFINLSGDNYNPSTKTFTYIYDGTAHNFVILPEALAKYINTNIVSMRVEKVGESIHTGDIIEVGRYKLIFELVDSDHYTGVTLGLVKLHISK